MSDAIVLSGGTGLIGGRALPSLSNAHEVRLLTRNPERWSGDHGSKAVGWDGQTPTAEALAGARCVVHLAGEPIFGGLPSKKRLARLRESRIASTRAFVQAFGEHAPADRPDTFVCASAVGFYGDRGDELLDEGAAKGDGFLADLCADWEAEAARARELGMRVVSLRFGVVLAQGSGALGLMAPIFKTGLAGRLGSGRQWFPWIHIDDAAALVVRAIEDPALEGIVNVVSPNPVRNDELTRALAAQLNRPAFIPAPAFAVKAALGPLADELLGSKRVAPSRAEARGHPYAHATIESALAHELG